MIIEITGLSKTFKEVVLLEQVNAKFESGKIYGIIGNNGVGKTMLLKMILGLSPYQEGIIKQDNKILGRDIKALKSVGAIIEEPKFYNELSGTDNLKFLSSIYKDVNYETIDYLIDMFELKKDLEKKVGRYSLGMKQKLSLIQAFMEDNDLLILDEPTNALDKNTIDKLFSYLTMLKNKGCLIIVTLHRSNEITSLCDVVYKIENKKLHEAIL